MTRARRLGKCVASVLLLAAANESVETRGGRITRSNAVLRLEQLGQLGGLEDAILQVVSLSTQVGGESIAVARLEGAQVVDIACQGVTLGLELAEELGAAGLGIGIDLVSVALGVRGHLLGIDAGAGLDALGTGLGIDGELVSLGLGSLNLATGLLLSLVDDTLGVGEGQLNHADNGRRGLGAGGHDKLLDAILGGRRLLLGDRGSTATGSKGMGITQLGAKTLVLAAQAGNLGRVDVLARALGGPTQLLDLGLQGSLLLLDLVGAVLGLLLGGLGTINLTGINRRTIILLGAQLLDLGTEVLVLGTRPDLSAHPAG